MKKLLVATLAVFSVMAMDAQAAGIAVVDEMQVFDQTDALKSAQAELKQEDEKIQKRLEEMTAEVKRRQDELKKKRGILSDEKFLDEETELRKLVGRYRNEEREMMMAIEKTITEKRNEIMTEIRDVVGEIAKERGFDAIISKGTLLYNIEKIDISAEVLEKVNKRLNKKG